MKRRVLLYFGSFNPVHNGHIALAEYAVEHDIADSTVLVVSPRSPFKDDDGLAPEIMRFEMAEAACAASRHPERIVPSAVEFVLDKPSYTIDTLRFLESNNGGEMDFSILMGADNVPRLHEWREADAILSSYDIYVYPRKGFDIEPLGKRMHILHDAPLADYSSTDVRRTLRTGGNASAMIAPAVAAYILEKGLWSVESNMRALAARIEAGDKEALRERGEIYFRRNEWGNALNDFNRIVETDPEDREAAEMTKMIYEILEFRYTDIYNP